MFSPLPDARFYFKLTLIVKKLKADVAEACFCSLKHLVARQAQQVIVTRAPRSHLIKKTVHELEHESFLSSVGADIAIFVVVVIESHDSVLFAFFEGFFLR
jgi:hypothetical protein